MQVEFPDVETHTRIDTERPMDDDEYFEFCAKNSELRIEREANGEITIMPPTGFETGFRNSNLATQLGVWTIRDGRGIALDSNTEYLLPNGAARAPDASWVLKSRLAGLSTKQKTQFPRLCPDFVVDLTSPSDRLVKVKAKMAEWIANGAALGWLIDADRRTLYVYRPGKEPEELRDVASVDGEGPIEGFRLELAAIWAGL